MQDFRSLAVWRKSHEFTLAVYRVTSNFPTHERYSLTSQLRRSAASIPSNIAEGAGRAGGADFIRFLQIACGSASEAEYQLLLARDLGYIDEQTYSDLERSVQEIKRMLSSFMDSIRRGMSSP